MTVTIEVLKEAEARAERAALGDLLRDAVEGGASVGFVLPLSDEEAGAYWEGVAAAVGEGARLLLVARQAGRIVGTVQLALETRRNGLHRAEVSKLLVHTAARRRGIARALMNALEEQARQHDRTTLYLDTRLGDPAEQLYQAIGYRFVGFIPRYARSPDGGALEPNAIYYRLLDEPGA